MPTPAEQSAAETLRERYREIYGETPSDAELSDYAAELVAHTPGTTAQQIEASYGDPDLEAALVLTGVLGD